MENILVFGGCFDPPHSGHVQAALTAMIDNATNDGDIDSIWFLPCYKSISHPHLSPGESRLEMTRRAIDQFAAYFHLEVCDYEIKNKCDIGTVDILNSMNEYYNPKGYLIKSILIGSDEANEIYKWKGWKTLITKYKFIVVARPGHPINDHGRWCLSSPHRYIDEIPDNSEYICSTQIRKDIFDKKPITQTPESVTKYIADMLLYLPEDEQKAGWEQRGEKFIDELKKYLKGQDHTDSDPDNNEDTDHLEDGDNSSDHCDQCQDQQNSSV